jgi:type II secretory pathway pseudopilin PulG
MSLTLAVLGALAAYIVGLFQGYSTASREAEERRHAFYAGKSRYERGE